jgi:hypothetical protein
MMSNLEGVKGLCALWFGAVLGTGRFRTIVATVVCECFLLLRTVCGISLFPKRSSDIFDPEIS